MKNFKILIITFSMLIACNPIVEELEVQVFETSAGGNKLTEVKEFEGSIEMS